MGWINILSIFFPVGAIYFSTVNTSPASVVGGTWSQLTGGMLGLAGSDGVAAAGSNGGSKTISVDQMPTHNHTAVQMWTQNGGSQQLAWGSAGFSLDFDTTLTTTSVGGGRIIFPLTLLSMLGDVQPKGGER